MRLKYEMEKWRLLGILSCYKATYRRAFFDHEFNNYYFFGILIFRYKLTN